MGQLLDELLALRVPRAGGVAWEYYFASPAASRRGSRASRRARASSRSPASPQRTGREEEVLPIAEQALGVFKTPPPAGVRVRDRATAPSTRSTPSTPGCTSSTASCRRWSASSTSAGSATTTDAQALYAEGERAARRELPTFDTGAWSLYSRGSVEHESDLSYHQLLRAFLRCMCKRTDDPVYCDTELRFAQYELEPPQLSLVTTRLRGGTLGNVRVRLSKISRVGLRVQRGGRVVSIRAAVVVGHGTPVAELGGPAQGGRLRRRR